MSLSTSLAEARQLYALLGDIEQKLKTVDAEAKQSKISYNDLYNVMQDAFMIIRELGLPDEVEHAVAVIHRLIVAMNALRVAMIALEAATVTSPIGWALVGIGFTASLISSLAGVNSAINMRMR